MAKLTGYPHVSDPFAPGTHSGLNFAYGAARVGDDNTVTDVAAGTVALADNSTNYIELTPSTGVVSANAVAFTSGKIPLFTALTASGAITTVTDKRAFLRYGSGSGVTSIKKTGEASAITGAAELTQGTGVSLTQSGQAIAIALAAAALKRGIALGINGTLAVNDAVSLDTDDVARTATGGRLSVDVAPVGAALIVQCYVNGSAMFSSPARPTIADGATSGTFSAPDLVTAIPAGSTVKTVVEQVGSGTAGETLRATLNCTLA